ncbi:MAG: MoaD/ThiS family protein [Pseudomonadota bacterium]|nr:MoaD/ThiS family protein [Pseudomonadota bacterium]
MGIRVVLSGELPALAGGAQEIELEAADVLELMRVLRARHPALAAKAEADLALAVNGVIYQRPFAEALPPGAEVCFIPRIAAG